MESVIDIKDTGFSQEEIEDINRCLTTLYSVIAGTMPLDRNFGININEIMGYPTEVAKNKLSVEIISKTRIYEPRVSVYKVECETLQNGQIKPHIYVKKGE